jgi:hypothetical protein
MKNHVGFVFIVSLIAVAGIFAASYTFANKKVLSDVKEILPEENIKKVDNNKIDKFSSIKSLWEKHSIKIPLKPLFKPIKFYEKVKNFKLTYNKSVKTKYLEFILKVREKTHSMGNNDTHGVYLKINNLTKKYLSYRVITKNSKMFVVCQSGRTPAYHSFLIEPSQKIERFEGCTFTKKIKLEIELIQILELPKAGFINLERLSQPLGLPVRLRSGHRSSKGILPGCIMAGVDQIEVKIKNTPRSWIHIMTFLAQHDCAVDQVP